MGKYFEENTEKIYVTKAGYDEFFEELEHRKEQFMLNGSSGSKMYQDAVGDGWHDNFDFENSMREENKIAHSVDKMLRDAKRLVIVEEKKLKTNVVHLDDTIRVILKFSDDDQEEELIKLTGMYFPSVHTDSILEVTLNSPIGAAIYQKKIPSKTYYEVNDAKVEIEIIEKIDT